MRYYANTKEKLLLTNESKIIWSGLNKAKEVKSRALLYVK